MYKQLMEAGWTFNDIDNTDYFGLLDYLSANNKPDYMSGEDFFNSI
jgi:hypothetical protein